MPVGADQVYQPGFFEACLRRCGERPYKSFLMLWLILFLTSLPIAVVEFNHMRFAGEPPLPSAIPYRDYMAGGKKAESEGTISLDPSIVPEFDPALVRQEVGFHVRRPPEGLDSESRLCASFPHYVGWTGWPRSALSWGSRSEWDVTDPTQPFTPRQTSWQRGPFLYVNGLSYTWVNEDGARAWGITVNLPGALMQLALPQAIAATVVMTLALAFRCRNALRRRRKLCLSCGHGRDPLRLSSTCPECGMLQVDNELSSAHVSGFWAKLRTPGGFMVAALVCFVAAGLLLQPLGTHRSETNPVQPQITNLEAAATSMGRSFTSRVTEGWASYGWPVYVMVKQVDHWYTFSSGAQATPAPRARRFELIWHYDHIEFTLRHTKAHISTLVLFYWPMAIFELALLQIAATVLSGTMFLLGLARRRRAARCA